MIITHPNKSYPFLITGLGHSGTAWAAKFFTKLGFPCGHERIFNPHDRKEYPRLTVGESSWLAVPRLSLVDQEIPIIHIVRNPIKVAQSYFRLGSELSLNPKNEYARFVMSHQPWLTELSTELDRIVAHISTWDEPLLKRSDTMMLPVEKSTTDTDYLRDIIMFATGINVSPELISEVATGLGTKINAHARNKQWANSKVTWSSIKQQSFGKRFAQRAELLGYGESAGGR